ncbi:hypothetical protein E1B28_009492 [Marasmius oreades]|uniref:Cytochrome P450 n=1 Tax=Marasmius oreades TaxID=181124 RepID=A0A9P7RWP7_9AGAR|nr:uncharacterized protein E1B28_009492 [Marasmius oreades]KAG7090373.1 hypothetical protein E1B28_009492 [Marasmius oreades]
MLTFVQNPNFLCSLLVVVIAWCIHRFRITPQPPPNSPPIVPGGLPWIGFAYRFIFKRHDLLQECRAKYGPIFKVPIAGTYCTVVSSPTAIAAVITKSPRTLQSLNDRAVRTITGVAPHRVSTIASLLQHHVFGIISAKMSKRAMGSFFVGMSQNLSKRLDHLVPLGTHSQVQFSLRDLIMENFYQISAPTFFGTNVPDVYSEFIHLDNHIFQLLNDIPFIRRGAYHASERLVKAFIPYVQQASVGDGDIYVEGASVPLMDSLQQLMKAGISTEEIARIFVAVTWGFHSNIIHTLIDACAYLASDPIACRSLTKHVRSVITKRWTDLDTFLKEEPLILDDPEFAILDSLLQETLRVVSVASSGRKVLRDTAIPREDGTLYWIRKGEFVLADVAALHNDPEIYPNPEKFRLDRFLNVEVSYSARSVKNLVPWGGGPFVCKGREYAEYIFKAWFIQLLLKYDVSMPSGYKPSLCQNISPTIARLAGNPHIILQRPTP